MSQDIRADTYESRDIDGRGMIDALEVEKILANIDNSLPAGIERVDHLSGQLLVEYKTGERIFLTGNQITAVCGAINSIRGLRKGGD